MWVETYPERKMYNLDNFTELEEDCVQDVSGSFIATLYGINTSKKVILCMYVKPTRSLACSCLSSEIGNFKCSLLGDSGFYIFKGQED